MAWAVAALALAVAAQGPAAAAAGGPGPATRPLAGRLVCAGASETEGQMASRPDLGYVGRLAALARDAGDDLAVVNEGRSGWSTGAYAYNAAGLAAKLPADTTVVTIMLGTNDVREKRPPAQIAAAAARNLDRLITTYQARVPRARFVILTPTAVYPAKLIRRLRDAGYDATGPAKLAAIDAAYAALAARLRLQLIDLSDLPGTDASADGVHADDAGHARIAERVWRELNQGQTPGPATRPDQDPDVRPVGNQ